MRPKSPIGSILFAGLLAGTLDISAAIVFLGNLNAKFILQYVASGAFGKIAFTENWYIWFGLIFHYTIALTIATLYFFIFPRFKFLKINSILSAIMIGLGAWAFMNLVVVPLSEIGSREFNLTSTIKNMVILIVCIGLPIAIITKKYYERENGNSMS